MENGHSRVIHHSDAILWLKAQKSFAGCSFITSLPDYSEFPSLSLEEWKRWFVEAAQLVLRSCPADGVVIFYQRDSKQDGAWIDKGFLCQKAAEAAESALVWHKIVCRAPPGNVTFGRPAYSHLLCFSRSVRPEIARSRPDVLPLAGKASWTRGMGEFVCEFACRFVKENTRSHTVVDPFCGHGAVLAVANLHGLDAVGVELSRKRAAKAREMRVKLP